MVKICQDHEVIQEDLDLVRDPGRVHDLHQDQEVIGLGPVHAHALPRVPVNVVDTSQDARAISTEVVRLDIVEILPHVGQDAQDQRDR